MALTVCLFCCSVGVYMVRSRMAVYPALRLQSLHLNPSHWHCRLPSKDPLRCQPPLLLPYQPHHHHQQWVLKRESKKNSTSSSRQVKCVFQVPPSPPRGVLAGPSLGLRLWLHGPRCQTQFRKRYPRAIAQIPFAPNVAESSKGKVLSEQTS